MQPTAIEVILRDWDNQCEENLVGLMYHYLNSNTNRIVGEIFPKDNATISYIDYYGKLKVAGDKVLVVKSEAYKAHLYPEYPGEKLFPDGWKYFMLGDICNFKLMNDYLIKVAYTTDGYSKNLIHVMANAPRGYKEYHQLKLRVENNFLQNMKSCIHVVGFSFLSKDYGCKNFYNLSLYKKILFGVFSPVGLIWGVLLSKDGKLANTVLNIFRKTQGIDIESWVKE